LLNNKDGGKGGTDIQEKKKKEVINRSPLEPSKARFRRKMDC